MLAPFLVSAWRGAAAVAMRRYPENFTSVARNLSTRDKRFATLPLGVSVCAVSCLALGCMARNELSSYSAGELGAPAAVGADKADGDVDPGGAVPTPTPTPTPGSSAAAVVPSSAVDAGAVDAGASDAGLVDAGATAPDELPGSVASTFPPDGARGVSADVALVIDFGRAMDKASVSAALQTDDLPLAGASFAWSDGDSVVHVTFAQPLELAVGSEPAAVTPLCYSYRISEAALDATGRPITPASVAFCTARHINQALSPTLDADSSGNFRSDGNYGDGTCGRGTGTACVGDSAYVANSEYRGFLTFDSRAVPDGVDVLSAELRVQIAFITGNPMVDLGALLVEQVHFSLIGPEAFAETAVESLGVLSPVPDDVMTLRGDIAPALRGPQDGRTQLRLRFSAGSDMDGASDHLQLRSDGTLGLRVDYLIP